jgi:copper chaperone
MAMQKEIFQVEGMSCNHCKMAVENAVKKLPGMLLAEVDLAAKTLQVEYDDEKIKQEKIRQAVEETGFEVA